MNMQGVTLAPQVTLRRLTASDAPRLAALLADPALYRFTGQEPPSIEQCVRWAGERSPDGRERWRNWLVHRAPDGKLIGWVQATIRTDGAGRTVAELASTIAVVHQGRGYAQAAVVAAAARLREEAVQAFVAYVHPGHAASLAVARSLGMKATGAVTGDGELELASGHDSGCAGGASG
jgi:RimJ/RimL family protein N-acetyltransferase